MFYGVRNCHSYDICVYCIAGRDIGNLNIGYLRSRYKTRISDGFHWQ
jgi:hypothetical protein